MHICMLMPYTAPLSPTAQKKKPAVRNRTTGFLFISQGGEKSEMLQDRLIPRLKRSATLKSVGVYSSNV